MKKVFFSVFQHEKCSACNKAFHITMKRRCCKQCQKLFCTECSLKVKANRGILNYKRYCLQCYAIIEKKSRATEVFPQKIHESQPRQLTDNFNIDSHNLEDFHENERFEEIKEKPKEASKPPPEEAKLGKKLFVKGISKRLSCLLPKPITPSDRILQNQSPYDQY